MNDLIQTIKILESKELKIINDYIDKLDFSDLTDEGRIQIFNNFFSEDENFNSITNFKDFHILSVGVDPNSVNIKK